MDFPEWDLSFLEPGPWDYFKTTGSFLDFTSALRVCNVANSDEDDDEDDSTPTLNILHLTYIVEERIGQWWKGACFRPKKKKTVLNDVSFQFSKGQLTGVLGSSGSGKTSLLDVIACRTEGTVSGDVFYKQYACTKHFFRLFGSYVIQADRLLPNLTVRETLRYSAKLRLPGNTTSNEIDQKVTKVINDIGLRGVADTKIGSGIKRGLSGGEKRRVTIAIQLLQNPKILLLDEPTSGLDSYTARSLVSSLANLAHQGKIVVITIHQPRSEIYRLFDYVGILSRGQVVYYGKTNQMVNYFSNIDQPCPQHANPLDHYVDLASIDRRNKESEHTTSQKVAYLTSLYEYSDCNTKMKADIEESAKSVLAVKSSRRFYRKHGPSIFRIFATLLSRFTVNLARDRNGYMTRIFLMIAFIPFICIFLGRLQNTQKSLQDRIGLMYQSSQVPYYIGILIPVALFSPLRDVYYRECQDGLYGIGVFMVAYIVHIIPFQLFSSLVFSSVVYWVTGLRPLAERFGIYTVVIFFIHFCGEMVTIGIMAIFINPQLANGISAIILAASGMFGSGFLRSLGTMIDVISWLSWATMHKYCSEILVANEFEGLNFTCPNPEIPPCPFPTGDIYLKEFYPGAVENMGRNFGALVAFSAGYVVLNILAFKIRGIPNMH